MATMPKNPAWTKKKDEPRRRSPVLPDFAADAATGPSRQVRRRAGRILVAREAAADRVLELAARKATVKQRQAERQARQSAVAAYEAIKSSGTATPEEIERAHEAMQRKLAPKAAEIIEVAA